MKETKFILFLMILFGLVGFIPNSPLLGSDEKLSAGSAKLDITPTNGVVHDPLYLRALVLDVNGYRVAIISCDLIYYFNAHLLEIARERYNISHVLTSGSHTHSGARSRDTDSPYGRFVLKRMIEGLDKAVKNMFPARISAGYRSFPQLTYNRLIIRENGHARGTWVGDKHISPLNPERIPYGPVDPEVGVIKIEDERGKPRIIIMNYACHSDVVAKSYKISADYPGVACRKVEEEFGKDMICLFVQGGAGNIAPLFVSPRKKDADDDYPTDYSQIEKMGTLLSYEVIKLARSLMPPANEKAELKAMSDSMKFAGRFNRELEFDVHITTVLINNEIAIAAFPGEPFIYFQLHWKEHTDVAHPFLFGYTMSSGGQWPGYVPDIRSAALGGFGADTKPNGIEIGAGEKIINKHLENLYRLKGLVRNKPGPKPDFESTYKYLRKPQ